MGSRSDGCECIGGGCAHRTQSAAPLLPLVQASQKILRKPTENRSHEDGGPLDAGASLVYRIEEYERDRDPSLSILRTVDYPDRHVSESVLSVDDAGYMAVATRIYTLDGKLLNTISDADGVLVYRAAETDETVTLPAPSPQPFSQADISAWVRALFNNAGH